MSWDASVELSALQERFQKPPAGWNCELLNARWRNFRHDLLCEGGLWLPLSSEPGKLIPGFVYLRDETLGEPTHKNGSQACYSTATELAAEEFRRLAILGGDVVSRIPQLKSELQPFVDGNGVGPPADHERWWLAYLFREVASEIVGLDLNVEAVGLGKGLTYEVAVEGVFRASEAACKRLIELVAPAVEEVTPNPPQEESQKTSGPVELQQSVDDDIVRRLAILFGDSGGKMLAVIQGNELGLDQKLRVLERIDKPRIAGMDSEALASILGVTGQAVRKTDWWKERQKRPSE